MRRAGLWVFALGSLALNSGCISSLLKARPSALPDYVHKIAVRPFGNVTQQYGLEDKLTLAAQSEFNRDGRYQISAEGQADGVVTGQITKYILEPLSYDANHIPTEYKLTILVTISFLDKVKNQTLWTDPSVYGELRYFVASSGLAGSLTEDEARQTIWDQLSRDIVTRTIEVGPNGTGGSDKSGSKSGSELYNAPPPLDNNPPQTPNPQPDAPSPMKLPY